MTPPGARDLFLDVNGVRLHLLDWGGDGSPILCVHATGYLAALWHPIAVALKDEARVLGVDLPGHGDSEPAPDYRWDHLAEYVGGALRALEVGPALLVGHSVGGATSVICAARYPELVRAMVLADPVVLPEPFYHRPEAAESSDFYGVRSRRSSWPSREAMRESLQSKAAYARWQPEMLDLYVREGVRETDDGVTLKCSPETEVQVYLQTLYYNLWPEIAHADVPAIVLRGLSKEGLASVTAPELLAWLPRAEDRPLPDASHHVPMEYPEEVIRAARDLLIATDQAR
ncbi:MAG: alpha/beta hydrolase [Dehalococcoidia bacterium]|nr:alpha/beta hydrolase [Dehalococcoidia bacterium]